MKKRRLLLGAERIEQRIQHHTINASRLLHCQFAQLGTHLLGSGTVPPEHL
jgi:hypothetical protein